MIKRAGFSVLVFSTLTLIASSAYSQVSVDKAVDDLLANAISQIKALSAIG